MKKLDLHMHPLCHEYYDGWTLPHNVTELTEMDQKRIREVVDWCYELRKLDVISITDHDMALSSFYARDYARGAGIPMIVLPGIEMEVHSRGERVHLCAWGIDRQPRYFHGTPIPELVKEIHDMGGLIIMNHPAYSPYAFKEHYGILDGYEYVNSGVAFTEGRVYLRDIGAVLPEYRNSDYHYDPARYKLPDEEKFCPQLVNHWSSEKTDKWLERINK